MADQVEESKEPTAWDRVGQVMADMAGVGGRIAERNLKVWTSVSGHLRGPTYKVDDMTTDLAQSWMAAMDNLDDLWSLWTRVPDREQVAADLPTAFLLLRRSGKTYSVADPVWIRIPPHVKAPPPEAQFDVAGTDEEGADALRDCLKTVLGRGGQAYMLSIAYPKEGIDLRAGTYSGIVYLSQAGVPLANLRIVVEGRSA